MKCLNSIWFSNFFFFPSLATFCMCMFYLVRVCKRLSENSYGLPESLVNLLITYKIALQIVTLSILDINLTLVLIFTASLCCFLFYLKNYQQLKRKQECLARDSYIFYRVTPFYPRVVWKKRACFW